MTVDKQSIIDKISALKRKSEDAGCTEAEALMFAQKVADLMEKHAVNMHELGEKPDHINNEQLIRWMRPWRKILLRACADTCFCTAVVDRKKLTGDYQKVMIIGRPLNTQTCYEMFYFIESQIVQVAKDLYPGEVTKQRRAEDGLARGIVEKLYDSKMSTQEAKLPVVQEIKAANKAAYDFFPNLRSVPARKVVQTREHVMGHMNAGRVQLRENIK